MTLNNQAACQPMHYEPAARQSYGSGDLRGKRKRKEKEQKRKWGDTKFKNYREHTFGEKHPKYVDC